MNRFKFGQDRSLIAQDRQQVEAIERLNHTGLVDDGCFHSERDIEMCFEWAMRESLLLWWQDLFSRLQRLQLEDRDRGHKARLVCRSISEDCNILDQNVVALTAGQIRTNPA